VVQVVGGADHWCVGVEDVFAAFVAGVRVYLYPVDFIDFQAVAAELVFRPVVPYMGGGRASGENTGLKVRSAAIILPTQEFKFLIFYGNK